MVRLLQWGLIILLFLIVAPIPVSAAPVPDDYVSAISGPCRVAVPKHNKGLLQELLNVCEPTYDRVYRQLGLLRKGDVGGVQVRVVGDPSEIASMAPQGAAPPSWAGAVAYPEARMVILSLRNRIGSPVKDLDIVLEHEISHLALREALGGADVPRWFSEGVAIQQSEKSSFRRYWLVWLAARGDSLLPLESINRYPDHEGKVNLAYAQAADFVGFLLRKEGWLGVRVAVRKRAGGVEFQDAFEYAFRDSVASLEDEWRAGLRSRWQWLPLLTGTGAVWGFIVALFLVAYAAAKRRKARRYAEMEEEEDRLERLVTLGNTETSLRSPTANEPQVPTKIRVDDEIHTLH